MKHCRWCGEGNFVVEVREVSRYSLILGELLPNKKNTFHISQRKYEARKEEEKQVYCDSCGRRYGFLEVGIIVAGIHDEVTLPQYVPQSDDIVVEQEEETDSLIKRFNKFITNGGKKTEFSLKERPR